MKRTLLLLLALLCMLPAAHAAGPGDALPHRLLLPRDGFSRGHALGPERHLRHVRAGGRRGDGLPW